MNNYGSNLFSQDNLQWKKATKNLHKFIESKNIQRFKKYQKNEQKRRNRSGRNRVSLVKSVGYISDSIKGDLASHKSETNIPQQKQVSTLSKSKSCNNKSFQLQKQNLQKYLNHQTQTSQQQIIHQKNFKQQNNCLQQLITVLQKQILEYSQKISSAENQLNNKNHLYQQLERKHKSATEQLNQFKKTHKIQAEMTSYLQEIIFELNEKISQLLRQNTELGERLNYIDAIKQTQSIDIQNSPSQTEDSRLSIESSVIFPIQISSFCEFNTPNIGVDENEQNNLSMEDNWVFDSIDMSFSKTPFKIHEKFSKEKINCVSAQKDFQFQEIIRKYKGEISQFKDKLKYLEIENSMLKRKVEINEKSKDELVQLKQRIQKLTQQNKIIKLIKNSNKEKTKIPSETQFKHCSSMRKTKNERSIKQYDIQSELYENVNHQRNQFSAQNQQKQILKNGQQQQKTQQPQCRKNIMERKFVRKQIKAKLSPDSKREDSQICFELSPQKN